MLELTLESKVILRQFTFINKMQYALAYICSNVYYFENYYYEYFA